MSYLHHMGRPGTPRGAIGISLARLRSEADLSQEQLAERSGVSRRTIAGIETGSNENPELGSLAALAKALGRTVADIVGQPVMGRVGEAAIAEFIASPVWNGQVLRPPASSDEIAWVRTTAMRIFGALRPTPETIARLIEARRSAMS